MINWILQQNLTKPEILESIKKALTGSECWEEVIIAPFSRSIPVITHRTAFPIVYGSTTFMLNAYRDQKLRKGVFYDPAKFRMSNYVKQWKDDVLNADGQLLKFGELRSLVGWESEALFIRPDNDGKEFSGKVETHGALSDWSSKVCKLNIPELNSQTEIWISSPKSIDKEWRLFVVDNEVISSSRYMKNGVLNIDNKDVPEEMIGFAEKIIHTYRIADIYALDIAQCEGQFKVIECNCFNGTGFYDHDISRIVKAVNTFVKANVKK